MAAYIPGQGDIVAMTFDPRSGHEKKAAARPWLSAKGRLTGEPITKTPESSLFSGVLIFYRPVPDYVLAPRV